MTAATALVCSPPPDCSLAPCPQRLEAIQLRQQAHFYQALHQRSRQRESQLQQRIAELEAEIRLLKQQLFGRKAEPTPHRPDPKTNAHFAPPLTRRRGQQPGRPSPPRRDHSQLPAVVEDCDLDDGHPACPHCGLPFAPFPGTDDGEILEIDVRAYRRVYRRRRYRPTCGCDGLPPILTAPPPAKLIPKSHLGVSVWVTVLLDKFAFGRPTYRLLEDLHGHGLPLSAGTLTAGLQRLLPLFEPVYEALVKQSRQADHWHADETRWLVFVSRPGKVGPRWYLWAFLSATTVVFVLAPGRSHAVPEDHLGEAATGILNVDRYSAYKALPQVKNGQIRLAFCWAHQRRDFWEVATSWPSEATWAREWLTAIGALYYLNEQRLTVAADPAAFAPRDNTLRQAVAAMQQRWQQELATPQLHPARAKALASLGEHWEGLTLFVEHPTVPMDNNAAERVERGPVVGRKNYYGSGSLWSGQLAALLFSVLQTLRLWDLNPRRWLAAYLQACAEAGGQAPTNVAAFLPWNLSEEQRREWSLAEASGRADTS